jgi:HEAT repeat protein
MKTNIIKRLFFISLFIMAVSFVLTPVVTRASAEEKANTNRYIETGDETFDRIFREARDLHDKEQYKEAVEKFNQIVCDCPDKKYVDAAFYWMAHSYKKLKMYKEAQQTLERLMKNFPNSSWSDDARVMMYELRGGSGQNVYTTDVGGSYVLKPGQITTIFGSNTVQEGNLVATQVAQLDREDEIKLAAFQSLLASEPKRAIEILSEILRADSKSSETLKREVIRTLRGSSYRGLLYGGNHWVVAPSAAVSDTQNISLLRDTLVRSFQNNSNVKIRTEIIYSLIAFNDEQSVNYLSQLYSSESDKEIKKAIINAFGGGGTGYAIAYAPYFGQVTPLTATTINKVTAAERVTAETAAVKANADAARVQTPKAQTENILVAKTLNDNSKTTAKALEFRKIYFDKLMEITRTEKDLELKRLAFSHLQRFSGWSTRDGMVDIFSQMYDSEADEQFKISIIQAFSSMKQDQAINKLLNIAKNDKSDKLRLEAIYSLRGNKNPEVIKFLEDLIK